VSVPPEPRLLGSTTEFVTVDRVLGVGPFAEIGHPRVVATSATGALIAVAGDLGWAQWSGWDARVRYRPLGIYRAADLTCVHLIKTRWPVNSIAFHPSLPTVAIGTGSYDGGYAFEGELLLLDLVSGHCVSVLDQCRQVSRVTWRDEGTLEIALEPPTDEHFGAAKPIVATVQRDDWDSLQARAIVVADAATSTAPREAGPDLADAEAVVESICRDRGICWAPRRQVWAVHALTDGSVLAALDGIALECWPPGAATPAWSLPVDGVGCQIKVAPGERTAYTNVRPPRQSFHDEPSVIEMVELADGWPRLDIDVDFPAVLVDRADGVCAARATERDATRGHGTVILASDGDPVGQLDLGHYDLINHFFDIRRAPELLFLQGSQPKPWRDKWIVAVEVADGVTEPHVRRRFLLDWDDQRRAHLFGGPGVYLDDSAGPAIVHAGAVYDGAGLLPGNAFVVRRSYPSGHLQWVFTADEQATAIDADDETTYVAFGCGELVALRSDSGAVLVRHLLTVNGQPVVPLSLCVAGAGRIVIGTLNGYVLTCSIQLPSAALE
jgi:hypothetical protein